MIYANSSSEASKCAVMKDRRRPAGRTLRASVILFLSERQPVEVETAGLGVGGLVFDQGEAGHLILHTRLFLKPLEFGKGFLPFLAGQLDRSELG